MVERDRFRPKRSRLWHYAVGVSHFGWHTLCGRVLTHAWRFALADGSEPQPCPRCLEKAQAEQEVA